MQEGVTPDVIILEYNQVNNFLVKVLQKERKRVN